MLNTRLKAALLNRPDQSGDVYVVEVIADRF